MADIYSPANDLAFKYAELAYWRERLERFDIPGLEQDKARDAMQAALQYTSEMGYMIDPRAFMDYMEGQGAFPAGTVPTLKREMFQWDKQRQMAELAANPRNIVQYLKMLGAGEQDINKMLMGTPLYQQLVPQWMRGSYGMSGYGYPPAQQPAGQGGYQGGLQAPPLGAGWQQGNQVGTQPPSTDYTTIPGWTGPPNTNPGPMPYPGTVPGSQTGPGNWVNPMPGEQTGIPYIPPPNTNPGSMPGPNPNQTQTPGWTGGGNWTSTTPPRGVPNWTSNREDFGAPANFQFPQGRAMPVQQMLRDLQYNPWKVGLIEALASYGGQAPEQFWGDFAAYRPQGAPVPTTRYF